jgi:predicted nucleic acid-binding protein
VGIFEANVLVVCDAGPIIHLDELQCLSVLNFSKVLIPEAVRDEVMKYRTLDFNKYPNFLISTNLILTKEVLLSAEIFGLHKGEIQAIALIQKEKASILLTDDSAARLFAKNMQIEVHGTIGVLLRAVRLGLKSKIEMIEIMENLKQNSTLHINQNLIREAISALERYTK